MKTLPAVFVAALFGLAGCSSSGTSFKAAEEKPASASASKSDTGSPTQSQPEPQPQGLPLEARSVLVVPSAQGGMAFRPVKDESTGLVQYMSGPVHYNTAADSYDNQALSEKAEAADVFKSAQRIDPDTVRHLELTGDDGHVLGRFQFVNQNYSSYGQFMARFNADPYSSDPEDISRDALAFYVAQPTTIEQLNQQTGTATYRGKVLGYRDGVNGPTPHEEAAADINLNVDFGEKMISGRVSGNERFDGLVKYHWRYTDDDDRPTARGKELSRVDLILKPTPIVQLSNGTVGFGAIPNTAGDDSPRANTENVVIMDGGNERVISQYGGVFAGPNAEEVVGQIGGGEERLVFGATRDQ